MTELDKFLEECETLAFDLETVNADEDTPIAFKKLVSIVKLQREALSHMKSCFICHVYPDECNALIGIEMKYNAITSEKE